MKDWTEIICILDRSGSMGDLVEDTLGGFNAFVDQQRSLPGKARLSLVLFDNQYELVLKHQDIKSVPSLTASTYFARGSTALLDAIGKTIKDVRTKIQNAHVDERPSQVVVLVMTDGYENASHLYTQGHVSDLVEIAQADGWEFVFVGADIDSFAVAGHIGIDAGGATNVSKSKHGMREAYSKMGRAVSQLRSTGARGDVDAPLSEEGWLDS